MNTSFQLSDLSTGALIGFGVLLALQLSVLIIALIKLLQTPEDRLVFGKRWVWLLIILFVNLIGGIIFLVAGRKPAIAEDVQPAAAPAVDRAAHAADVLYGDRDGE